MAAQVGRVKWFNKQKGYGFLTVSNESGDVDTFVHHSSINVGDSSFRYLVPGEYVSFTQKPMEGDKVCASDVTGVNGGKLTFLRHKDTSLPRAGRRSLLLPMASGHLSLDVHLAVVVEAVVVEVEAVVGVGVEAAVGTAAQPASLSLRARNLLNKLTSNSVRKSFFTLLETFM